MATTPDNQPDLAAQFAQALQPIAGASPAGVAIRYDPIYSRLADARRAEDASLAQGVWQREVKRADWKLATGLALEILTKHSKDIQVAAWLVESETRRRGFAGLAPSLSLLAGLCRDFWDGLFPAIEDGDLEARLAPLQWLNEKLPIVLHQIPITQSGNTGETRLTWTDYINAQRHEVVRQNDSKAATLAESGGRITLEAFNESAEATPEHILHATCEALAQAQTALAQLSEVLEHAAGRQAPSLGRLRDSIADIAGWADDLLPEPATQIPDEPPMEEMPLSEHEAAAQAPRLASANKPHPDGPITSREDAYRRLAEVADYLFRTERHSPVPYIIQRAIIWGELPLHELLIEISSNGSDLSQVLNILGLRSRP
jgi:type VI secretion system protein ImpA